jgi:hypothetical protein
MSSLPVARYSINSLSSKEGYPFDRRAVMAGLYLLYRSQPGILLALVGGKIPRLALKVGLTEPKYPTFSSFLRGVGILLICMARLGDKPDFALFTPVHQHHGT